MTIANSASTMLSLLALVVSCSTAVPGAKHAVVLRLASNSAQVAYSSRRYCGGTASTSHTPLPDR